MRLKLLVATSVIAAVGIVGCSSTSSSSRSSTTTTAVSSKQAVCVARDNLKSSVAALASPSLLTGGKAGIQSALNTVKTNLDAVASEAGTVYKPQVDAVKTAVSDLQTALSNLGSGSTTNNLQAAGTAIANIGTTAETLITTLQTECP
jgi:hypothetical protein